MIRSILFSCFIFLITTSCKKDDDVNAPPITAENTFSCKIDGKTFVPENHGKFPNSFDGTITNISDSNDWTFIFGNGNLDIYLYLADVTKTGNYSLSLSDGDIDFFEESVNLMEVDFKPSRTGSTHISTAKSGNIDIMELIKDERIILSFDKIVLSNKNDPKETITLSEGKLNINLSTLNVE